MPDPTGTPHPTGTPTRQRGTRPGVATTVLIGRGLRLSRRSVDAVLTALMLPVVIMLLFVYLFGGAIQAGTPHYVTYVVPGVLALCAGFGAATTAVTVSQDLTGGIVDRLRVMNVGGMSMIGSHVAASLVRNTASTLLVLGVAVMIGFRPSAGPGQWLAAFGLVLLFVLALSWLSATLGALVTSAEAANGVSFVAMFITYPSSAFVPVDTMPGWLQGFARHQPVTPVVEAIRALLLDRPVGSNAALAIVWTVGITAVSMVAAGLLWRRRTS